MLHKALFNCDWGPNPFSATLHVPELSMLMPDLSLHRSNSHSVDTSCRRIRTERKHTFHYAFKREKQMRRKKRGECVMSVLREYKVRSVSHQQNAVKGTCTGRWPPHHKPFLVFSSALSPFR